MDGLILSYLSYLDMDSLFLTDNTKIRQGEKVPGSITVSFSEAVDAYEKAHTKEEIARLIPPFNTIPQIARQAVDTARFGSLTVSDYVNIIDAKADEQMCAMLFWLDEDTVFVSFRGTDSTIIGWKEDFSLSYLKETPGQRHAVDYLNHVLGPLCGNDDLKVYVGGHSKGGNLAVYSSAFAKKKVRDRIVQIFANDAPGFMPGIVQRAEYRSMIPKIRNILPDSSIIGGLLHLLADRTVIASSEFGLMQHDALSWQVLGNAFVRAERSDLGRFFDESLQSWIGGLKEMELKAFTDALFDLLGAGGAKTVNEIRQDPLKTISEMMKITKTMDPKQKQEFNDVVLRLVKSSFAALKEQGGEKAVLLKDQSEKTVSNLWEQSGKTVANLWGQGEKMLTALRAEFEKLTKKTETEPKGAAGASPETESPGMKETVSEGITCEKPQTETSELEAPISPPEQKRLSMRKKRNAKQRKPQV